MQIIHTFLSPICDSTVAQIGITAVFIFIL